MFTRPKWREAPKNFITVKSEWAADEKNARNVVRMAVFEPQVLNSHAGSLAVGAFFAGFEKRKPSH